MLDECVRWDGDVVLFFFNRDVVLLRCGVSYSGGGAIVIGGSISRRCGHFEYCHAHTRAMDMPSGDAEIEPI